MRVLIAVLWLSAAGMLPAAVRADAVTDPVAPDAATPVDAGDLDFPGGGPDSLPYVIVTDVRLAGAFSRLARFRTTHGLRAGIFTLQQIRRRFRGGGDDAQRIRRFLRLAYDRWGTRWALIGGHDGLVPMRRVRIEVPPNSFDVPTDQYYACLDGSWNADGDSLWGEDVDGVDLDPELFVGRAPVRTWREAARFVEHTLAAERSLDPSDPRDIVLAAERLPSGVDAAAFAEAYLRFFEVPEGPERRVARLYEDSADYPGSLAESRASLLEALGMGPRLAVLIGGGDAGAFIAGDDASDRVTAADLRAVRTVQGHTSVVFLSGGVLRPGRDASVGEALLLAPGAGTAAVIGPTDVVFLGATNAFVRHLLEAVFVEGRTPAGEAMASSARALAQPAAVLRLTTAGMQLYGDPALPLRGGGPAPARVVRPEPALPVQADVLLAASPGAEAGPAPQAAGGRGRPVAVSVAAPVGPSLRLAGHNPARSTAEFAIDVPAGSADAVWSLAAYDLNGRRVRSLISGGSTHGSTRVVWDLRDDDGRRVPAGLYFAQLRLGTVSRSRMIVVTP